MSEWVKSVRTTDAAKSRLDELARELAVRLVTRARSLADAERLVIFPSEHLWTFVRRRVFLEPARANFRLSAVRQLSMAFAALLCDRKDNPMGDEELLKCREFGPEAERFFDTNGDILGEVALIRRFLEEA